MFQHLSSWLLGVFGFRTWNLWCWDILRALWSRFDRVWQTGCPRFDGLPCIASSFLPESTRRDICKIYFLGWRYYSHGYTMNATNGRSLGNQLPISGGMIEHKDAMAPSLRIDYSCVSQVLQAISNIAHVVWFAPSKSLTVEALDGFSLFPIPAAIVSSNHLSRLVESWGPWSSDQTREMILLREIGLSFSEIGALIGETPSQIENRLKVLTRMYGHRLIQELMICPTACIFKFCVELSHLYYFQREGISWMINQEVQSRWFLR